MTDLSFHSMTRRAFGAGLVAGAAVLVLPLRAAALDLGTARGLVDRAVGDVNRIISSGQSQAAMFGEFERLFASYADVPTIARSALGVAARSATPAQMQAFTGAYQGYIARKYGRRFRELIGGRIEVTGAQPLRDYVEVISVARLQGTAPFDVRWHVSDRAGRPLFFNIIIEGVNMLASERAEIGALLDRRGGNVGALAEDLRRL